MFQRIIDWIKGVFNNMLSTQNVKQALGVEVALSTDMVSAIETWSLMYENKATWLTTDIRSLGLPAAIADEIARMVTIEMAVEITGGPRAAYLADQMARVIPKLRERIGQGCAKGGIMLKPYVDGDQINVNYVQADQFYPVSYDADGNITAVVFIDQKTIGEKYYTRLEYHQMTAAGCEIVNMAYKSDTRNVLGRKIPLATVPDWEGLEEQALITGITKPLYAYFRYPLANNIDPNSPLGISCYSRAVDLIRQADELWWTLIWEFESKRAVIHVDVTAFDKDSNGYAVLPDKRLYRALSIGAAEIGKEGFYKEWSPEIRDASIKSGLDAILKRIEYTCGLSYGVLSDPQEVEKTSTEIAAGKQRTYATIVDTQKALKNALEQLLWAMDQYATIYGLAPSGTYATAYNFDDSVVVDREAQFAQDARALGLGVLSKVEFRMKNYGESEETAKAKIAAIVAEQPQDMFQGQGV